VELFKDEKGLTGQEAFNYLRKTGAVDFITGCRDGLHMTSTHYIVDSIDEYIKTHGFEPIAAKKHIAPVAAR